MPLPTNLTGAITPEQNRAYHAEIDRVLRLAGLRGTYTAGMPGHRDDHELLATYTGELDTDITGEDVGHAVVAHNRIHALVNRLEALPRYGPKPEHTKPAGALDVTPPGGLTQTLLDGQPTGTKFWLLAGVHRVTGTLTPRTNQQLHGQFGAVVSGAKELTGWTFDGSRWWVGGQTQRMGQSGTGNGQDTTNYPRYDFGDDVFRDHVPLRHVSALANLASGTFFFDYAQNRIYVADDPTGHLLEVCNATAIDAMTNSGIVLQNLVVEKFGNPAQTGALRNKGETLDCLVQLNHGAGIDHGDGGRVRRCKSHLNGQLGVKGNLFNKLIEDSEVCHNNYARYDPGWEAGGSKWATPTATSASTAWTFTGGSTVPDHVVGATGLHVKGCDFHDNRGPGVWADIDNYHVLVEGTRSERNSRSGLFHEISFDSIWRNNTARENGVGNDTGISFDEFVGVGPDPVRWARNGAGTVDHHHGELRLVAPATVVLRSTRGSLTNQELWVRVRRAAATPSLWLVLRGDNNESPLANGYILQLTFNPSGISGFLHKRVAGSTTLLDTVGSNTFEQDDLVWVRFQVEGADPNNVLRVRWWEEGTSQPTAWSKVLTGQTGPNAGAVRVECEAGSPTPDVRLASLRIDDLNRTTGIFWGDRANISVYESSKTWVLNNATRDAHGAEVVLFESDRSWALQDVTVRGNDVTSTRALGGGPGRLTAYERFAGAQVPTGLVWENNHYHLPSLAEQRWEYDFTTYTFAGWQATGRDTAASGSTADTNT